MLRLWMRRGPINCKVIPPGHPFVTSGDNKQVVIVIEMDNA